MKEKFLLFLSASTIFIILIASFLSLISKQPISLPTPIPISLPTSHFSLSPPVITLIAVGDVMLGRSVNAKMRKLNDFHYPFLKTAAFLKAADLTFANLESPFYDDCPTTNTGMIFCADPKAIAGLVFAGIDVTNLANNHIQNYGEEGVNLTQKILQENSITPLGLDQNLVVKEIKGTRFGFLGFDLTSGYQEEKIIEAVQENSLRVDLLIVSFHLGNEYAKQPSSNQVELAHQIIEAGADLILGHHPHVIQPTEEYQEKLIVYSMGNFVFDQPWSEETKQGLVGIFTFQDKKLIKTEFKEVYIRDYSQPELITP
jgi:poly-gamma-glutamate synthesis protein (capsule biosynthesis protein)